MEAREARLPPPRMNLVAWDEWEEQGSALEVGDGPEGVGEFDLTEWEELIPEEGGEEAELDPLSEALSSRRRGGGGFSSRSGSRLSGSSSSRSSSSSSSSSSASRSRSSSSSSSASRSSSSSSSSPSRYSRLPRTLPPPFSSCTPTSLPLLQACFTVGASKGTVDPPQHRAPV